MFTPSKDLAQGSEDIITIAYITKRNKRNIRLYPYKTRHYVDEDVWHWIDEVALELSDSSGNAWWRCPNNRIIWDLLEAVRFQTVGVDEFIEGIICDENDTDISSTEWTCHKRFKMGLADTCAGYSGRC